MLKAFRVVTAEVDTTKDKHPVCCVATHYRVPSEQMGWWLPGQSRPGCLRAESIEEQGSESLSRSDETYISIFVGDAQFNSRSDRYFLPAWLRLVPLERTGYRGFCSSEDPAVCSFNRGHEYLCFVQALCKPCATSNGNEIDDARLSPLIRQEVRHSHDRPSAATARVVFPLGTWVDALPSTYPVSRCTQAS